MQTDRRNFREIIARHFEANIDDERVIACAIEIQTGKRGDIMDGVLAFGLSPESKRENDIMDEIERGLKIHITRDSKACDLAKKIRIDGRSPETFCAWYRSDEFRLQSMPFMNIQKVWNMWPGAFETKIKEEEMPVPVELTEDQSQFTPMPDYIRRRIHSL